MMKTTFRPWNAGRHVGPKNPFSPEEIKSVAARLKADGNVRDLSMFCLGIDSLLRGSDLVQLTVGDVLDRSRQPKAELRLIQQKTGEPLTVTLSAYTRSVIAEHVHSSGLRADDWLFPSRVTGRDEPITTGQLRRLVKNWASLIGLDPCDYSSHSLRRSKPAHMYAEGVRPEMLRLLLGHKSLKSTQEYLGIDRQQALALAQKYDCFGEINR